MVAVETVKLWKAAEKAEMVEVADVPVAVVNVTAPFNKRDSQLKPPCAVEEAIK